VQVKSGECPTLNCTETQGRVFRYSAGGFNYDHLGRPRTWCITHEEELRGVRGRMTALVEQVGCLDRLTHFAAWADETTNSAIRLTLVAQGALLVKLIKREYELTGVAEPTL
jgi:hypothetical protein